MSVGVCDYAARWRVVHISGPRLHSQAKVQALHNDTVLMSLAAVSLVCMLQSAVVVVVVVLSNVDVGDPRCPIHGEDAIFTHKL